MKARDIISGLADKAEGKHQEALLALVKRVRPNLQVSGEEAQDICADIRKHMKDLFPGHQNPGGEIQQRIEVQRSLWIIATWINGFGREEPSL